MTFAPYPLPSANRIRHEDLARQVRHEYREDDAYWLASSSNRGTGLTLPGEMSGRTARDDGICSNHSRRAETRSGCPVLNAVSKGKLATDTPSGSD